MSTTDRRRTPFLPLCCALLLSAAPLWAAPLTVKELQFLIRQGTPEAEIVREATSRRLLAPLGVDGIAALKKSGATDSLIAKLNAPGIALSEKESDNEARRQAENKARIDAAIAADDAFRAARAEQWNRAAAQLREAHVVQGWLKDKLFHLERQKMVPVEPKTYAGARIFGFFFSSNGSGPSREFTPGLVTAYTRLKQQYGDDFEIILISKDRDEYNQGEYIRSFKIPFPTMKLGPVDSNIAQYDGDRLPWFVLVSHTGKPITVNAVDKRYIEPGKVLAALEQVLESTRQH